MLKQVQHDEGWKGTRCWNEFSMTSVLETPLVIPQCFYAGYRGDVISPTTFLGDDGIGETFRNDISFTTPGDIFFLHFVLIFNTLYIWQLYFSSNAANRAKAKNAFARSLASIRKIKWFIFNWYKSLCLWAWGFFWRMYVYWISRRKFTSRTSIVGKNCATGGHSFLLLFVWATGSQFECLPPGVGTF